MTEPAEPQEPQDFVIRSVTIAEVLDAKSGERAITYDVEGSPSDWDVLGLLEYTAAVIRNNATLDTDDE